MQKKKFIASVDSISQSDLYLTVKARLFTAPNANLNGCRCTEAFLDEIVANQDKYVGLPLSADVRNLCDGNYEKLGHMYNADTGEFYSTMIGSFYSFEKEAMDDGQSALIGYARVLKRNKNVCSAVCDLFSSGNLNFSFEVSCGEYTTLEDGTILIDASEKNSWEGEAIVWSPACPEAVALDLVAELIDLEKGDENMNGNKNAILAQNETLNENTTDEKIEAVVAENVDEVAEVTEVTETVEVEAEIETVAETEVTEEVAEETAEEETAEQEVASEQTAKCKNEKAEQTDVEEEEEQEEMEETAEQEEVAPAEVAAEGTATVRVENVHVEVDSTEVYDCNTGDYIQDRVEHVTTMVTYEMIAELEKKIAELENKISELTAEKVEVIASAGETIVNPFMSDIGTSEKYSLLEKEDSHNGHYSLLERY